MRQQRTKNLTPVHKSGPLSPKIARHTPDNPQGRPVELNVMTVDKIPLLGQTRDDSVMHLLNGEEMLITKLECCDDMGEEPMYDRKLLQQLDFTEVAFMFKPFISAAEPGEDLLVRPLCPADYDRGFIELLGQLTDAGRPTREDFLRKFEKMKSCPGTYYVTVVEDTRTGKVIGAATLFVEHKFIHGCSTRGHLEDVVVNNTYRGKQLGKLIVVTVTLLAKHLGCYKMSLECKDKLIPFYTSLGYKLEPGNSNSMVIRFEGKPS